MSTSPDGWAVAAGAAVVLGRSGTTAADSTAAGGVLSCLGCSGAAAFGVGLSVSMTGLEGIGATTGVAGVGAAVAMGADALLIEVHPNPAEAWSDAAQQLTLESFGKLMQELRPFIAAAGRE